MARQGSKRLVWVAIGFLAVLLPSVALAQEERLGGKVRGGDQVVVSVQSIEPESWRY